MEAVELVEVVQFETFQTHIQPIEEIIQHCYDPQIKPLLPCMTAYLTALTSVSQPLQALNDLNKRDNVLSNIDESLKRLYTGLYRYQQSQQAITLISLNELLSNDEAKPNGFPEIDNALAQMSLVTQMLFDPERALEKLQSLPNILDITLPNNATLLHIAAACADSRLLQVLLTKTKPSALLQGKVPQPTEADILSTTTKVKQWINRKDNDNNSALLMVTRANQPARFNLLHQHMANIADKDVILSAADHSEAILAYLMQRCPDNELEILKTKSIMANAAKKGLTQSVTLLTKLGAPYDASTIVTNTNKALALCREKTLEHF
ncbi:MAG: hypothetical protein KDH94_07265, partial [Coxiellaceae bacterium]|nr:hypothetical protein [Coxiellaceae bacterium]